MNNLKNSEGQGNAPKKVDCDMQHYICGVCGGDWSENGNRQPTAIETTCTGCRNEQRDRTVVWIRVVWIHPDIKLKYYSRCDKNGETGGIHSMPYDQWREIYDMCEVRIFEEPTPTPEPTELEDFKVRFKASVRDLKQDASTIKENRVITEARLLSFGECLNLIDTI